MCEPTCGGGVGRVAFALVAIPLAGDLRGGGGSIEGGAFHLSWPVPLKKAKGVSGKGRIGLQPGEWKTLGSSLHRMRLKQRGRCRWPDSIDRSARRRERSYPGRGSHLFVDCRAGGGGGVLPGDVGADGALRMGGASVLLRSGIAVTGRDGVDSFFVVAEVTGVPEVEGLGGGLEGNAGTFWGGLVH